MPQLSDKEQEIRDLAENDLIKFINLVAPLRVLGHVHEELANWWQSEDSGSHNLALVPRDHQKSAMAAYRVAQRIAKDPSVTVLYLSSTSGLAELQLNFIKLILTSPTFQRYWPDHVNLDEGKRAKWTNTEISLDHPVRAELGVRESTIKTAGLTTQITGHHYDVIVCDDVVVDETAYTNEGREKVRRQMSLLSSVAKGNSELWAVGTRYHPSDYYETMKETSVEVYNDDGELIDRRPLYAIFERVVEDVGDGTGQFLWPRQKGPDGRVFGFDANILAVKRAQYTGNMVQYYAQYYNDPNKGESGGISRTMFQYYDKKFLQHVRGKWFFKDRPLNVFAAMDLAFTVKRKSDFTAIVVIGVDPDMNIYVLDIARFKTDSPKEYFQKIVELKQTWDFKRIRAEVSGTQGGLVRALKEDHIKKNGLNLVIDESKPTRHDGTKEERIHNNLSHRYENGSMYHYRGGNCQILEEELIMRRPPHDDVKDALSQASEIAVAPINRGRRRREGRTGNVVSFNRFGGMS